MASATSSRFDPAAPGGGSPADRRAGWLCACAAVGTWGAAWLTVARSPQAAVVPTLVMLALAVTAGVLLRRRSWSVPVVMALVAVATLAAAGGLSSLVTSAHVDRRQSPVLDRLAAEGAMVRVVVRLTSDPRPVSGGQWEAASQQFLLDAQLLEVSWRGSGHQAATPLLITAGEQWSATQLDGVYTATGVLGPPRDRAGPYVATLRPQTAPVQVRQARWPWRAAEHVRARLRQAVRPLPGPAPGLLPSLAVGDTSGLPEELREDMRAAGLSHLTVVSGANVTLLCGGAVALVALTRGGPRRQVLAGAAALTALVLIARPDPSVLRAAVMGGIGLLGLLVGRPARAAAALAAACCLLLLIDPWLSRSYGLALSAAATAGIITLARPLARRCPAWLPRGIGYPLAVTVAAQASVTPILVLLDPALATYAVPANLLAGPVVAPTMVLTTVAALVAIASPLVAGWVAWPAAAGAAWLAGLSRVVADLPVASVSWWSGAPGVLAAVVLSGGVVAAVLCGARLRPPPPRARQLLVMAVPGVLLAGLLGDVAGLRPWSTAAVPDGWSVVVCDVGQGEAVLIRAGPAAAVVVDTGPDPALLTPCLAAAGVSTVPLLVLTHFHADHVGGLQAVLEAATVAQVWHSPQLSPAANAGEVSAALAAAGVPARAARTGDALASGEVTVEVLWPDRVLDPAGAVAGDGTSINDASLVLRVRRPGLTMLCLGDLETASQQRLLRTTAPGSLDADVTTIAHHGSGVQVPALYQAISPRLALASAGVDNDYGHPDPLTMAMVATTGATVMSTAAAGAVSLLVAADSSITVRPSRSGEVVPVG